MDNVHSSTSSPGGTDSITSTPSTYQNSRCRPSVNLSLNDGETTNVSSEDQKSANSTCISNVIDTDDGVCGSSFSIVGNGGQITNTEFTPLPSENNAMSNALFQENFEESFTLQELPTEIDFGMPHLPEEQNQPLSTHCPSMSSFILNQNSGVSNAGFHANGHVHVRSSSDASLYPNLSLQCVIDHDHPYITHLSGTMCTYPTSILPLNSLYNPGPTGNLVENMPSSDINTPLQTSYHEYMAEELENVHYLSGDIEHQTEEASQDISLMENQSGPAINEGMLANSYLTPLSSRNSSPVIRLA